jgi:hypothetical protein
MPAMEMEYWVKKKSLLKQARVGDWVDFAVVETGEGEYLTELTRARVLVQFEPVVQSSAFRLRVLLPITTQTKV